VDKLDDISAISDLYPEPGWPENYGTIKGTIRSLTKILGNGTGPMEEVTSVNLVARNLADPYNDFISTVSGELTRGANGPDGTFEMHGLTPGAQYVLYVDTINKGGYPYPSVGILPGPEEWYNGGPRERRRHDRRPLRLDAHPGCRSHVRTRPTSPSIA
jgi:hypothetical protein